MLWDEYIRLGIIQLQGKNVVGHWQPKGYIYLLQWSVVAGHQSP